MSGLVEGPCVSAKLTRQSVDRGWVVRPRSVWNKLYSGVAQEELNWGVLVLTAAGWVTARNHLAGQLLNAPLPMGQAVLLSQVLDPEGEPYQILTSIVASERDWRDCIVRWQTGDVVRHVLIESYQQRGLAGNTHGVLITIKDLANLTALEHQLQRSDKLATVGKIAAGIAHEIRNPMTTIQGFLQVLEQRLEAYHLDVETRYVHVMLHEVERVNRLVGELLMLAKPHKMARQPCDLRILLEELAPLLQSEALLQGLEFDCAITDLPLVEVDPAMIKQVILNLAKNGMEAMEEGKGALRIRAQVSGEWVQMDVSDAGPGIPYYQMDKIFDAFYTTKETGTGLGLPICQRIVADHGGELRISSKGFGTTVSVRLPVSPPVERPVLNTP